MATVSGSLRRASGALRSFRRGYRAALLASLGEPLHIAQRKEQRPHEGEICVQVHCAGFNYTDIHMIDGSYYLKPPTPFVPGFELSGTVKEVGKGVKKFKEGDRVVALKVDGHGAFAEECVLSEADFLFPIPFSIDFETAASFVVSYGSAYIALRRMATERIGSSVLVLSSRGTIDLAAIDLAQNVFKAQVLAASDNEEKLECLRSTGVQSTLNWTDGHLAKNVRSLTFGKGVDYIIDTVGGKPFQDAFNALKVGGTITSLGFSSGTVPSVSLLDLHRLQATITGTWLGGRSLEEMENIMGTVIGLFDEGYLTARVERKYPLDKLSDCVEDVKKGAVFGKTIITME